MATSSGVRLLELRTLQQGFCYLRSSSLPSSSCWHKRFVVLLDSGLIFFDPLAGPGTPVDKISSCDMRGARLIPQDPTGCTLEIFVAPPTTLELHVTNRSMAQKWLQILQVLIPGTCCDPPSEAHHSDMSVRNKEPSASLMGRAARLDEAQTMSFQDLGDQNNFQVILDQPEHDGGGKHSKGQLESLVALTSVQTQSGRICSSGQSRRSKRCYDTGENPTDKNRMDKTLSRQAGSSRSWSGEENIERAPTDSLIEDSMVSWGDNPSFKQPIQLVLEGEGSFSEPISMVGSPENGSSTKSNEDSSEGSRSGLTLTSKSSETPEGLEGNGSECEETLFRSLSINEERADFSPLALDQSDYKHSNDRQLHPPTSVSGEVSSTLHSEQELPLQHRLGREVKLSSTSQKVKSSRKPGLPPHLEQASAEADRYQQVRNPFKSYGCKGCQSRPNKTRKLKRLLPRGEDWNRQSASAR